MESYYKREFEITQKITGKGRRKIWIFAHATARDFFLNDLQLSFLTRVTQRSGGFAELVFPSSFWRGLSGPWPLPGLCQPGKLQNAEAAALPPAGLHLHKHGAFLEISFPELILAFSSSSRGRSVELASFWLG